MLDYDELTKLALECGFTNAGPLDVSTIECLPEVREMCESGRCRKAGTNWACPPACGTLDEMREKISKYKHGILVQTAGKLEDSFDFETMQEIDELQKENFEKLARKLEKIYPDLLAMGSGTCTRCKQCTYPDAPCRFPERRFSSMEACGLLVSKVCQDNKMPYNYGENTIAYTSCFLLE